MRKRLLSVVLLSAALATAGCGGTQNGEEFRAKHHIKQYSGGVLIGEWDTTANVWRSDNEYRFRDVKTTKWVYITGDVQVTVAD